MSRCGACLCRGACDPRVLKRQLRQGAGLSKPVTLSTSLWDRFSPHQKLAVWVRLAGHRALRICLGLRPSAGVTVMHGHALLFMWVLGSKLKSSFLQSKQVLLQPPLSSSRALKMEYYSLGPFSPNITPLYDWTPGAQSGAPLWVSASAFISDWMKVL